MRCTNPHTCPDRYVRDGIVYCPHVEDNGQVII